jgi:hypothetical protein
MGNLFLPKKTTVASLLGALLVVTKDVGPPPTAPDSMDTKEMGMLLQQPTWVLTWQTLRPGTSTYLASCSLKTYGTSLGPTFLPFFLVASLLPSWQLDGPFLLLYCGLLPLAPSSGSSLRWSPIAPIIPATSVVIIIGPKIGTRSAAPAAFVTMGSTSRILDTFEPVATTFNKPRQWRNV